MWALYRLNASTVDSRYVVAFRRGGGEFVRQQSRIWNTKPANIVTFKNTYSLREPKWVCCRPPPPRGAPSRRSQGAKAGTGSGRAGGPPGQDKARGVPMPSFPTEPRRRRMAGKAERSRTGARRLYGRRIALRDGQGASDDYPLPRAGNPSEPSQCPDASQGWKRGQGQLAGAHRPLSVRPGWILASLSTLPEGQGRAIAEQGCGIAGRPVDFLRQFSPSILRSSFFCP